jgi:hypothetical protein
MMAKLEGHAILYATDLNEIRSWLGSEDRHRFEDALTTLRDDEEHGWGPELGDVLERLLKRLIFENRLYEDLDPDDRIYLTQLLVDLFDEYADHDPVSEDLPLERLMEEARRLPKVHPAAGPVAWLARGRELGGDGLLWNGDPKEFAPPYLGFVRRDEVAALAEALQNLPPPLVQKGALLPRVRAAALECSRSELDLVSFIG